VQPVNCRVVPPDPFSFISTQAEKAAKTWAIA